MPSGTEMDRLAQYVAALGRGPTRSRPLEQHECLDAFSIILSGKADDVQIGAFFALLRYRGESPAELAGLVQAARTFCGARAVGAGSASLDWPSYAAGRTRGAPWFLLAAKLVAQAGFKVVLHGFDGRWGEGVGTREGANALAVPVATSIDEADTLLADQNLVFLDMAAAVGRLAALNDLRSLLGLRSPVNSLMRLLNPLGAPTSVVGVFHPSYRDLHRGTAMRLGYADLSVWKGGGGEAEINPLKSTALHRLVDGRPCNLDLAAPTSFRDEDLTGDMSLLRAVSGGAPASHTVASCVMATCAVALATLTRADAPAALQACMDRAERLWLDRARNA